VVSRAGGLAEFADGGRLALTFTPGDADSLAEAVNRALADPVENAQRARRASEAVLADYSCGAVAHRAVQVYEGAQASLGSGPDDPTHVLADARHRVAPPHFDSPPGRLLDSAR